MEKPSIKPKWLEFCRACLKKHRVSYSGCPKCKAYEVPMPVSQNVLDYCEHDYLCDACNSYGLHI